MEEFLNFVFIVSGYFFWIEIIKSFAVIFSLSKNGYPTQSSLRAFKDEHFKQLLVVVLGDTPLFIMVVKIERV